MALPTAAPDPISSAWEVLRLFLIPVGGGIPAGVLLARDRSIAWPEMSVLYFVSDVILALVFEPLMLGVIAAGKRSPFLARVAEAFRTAMRKTTSQYGSRLGPLALILVAFSADPMTGRSVAKAAGHGFVSGWALAITGDMFYFWVLMASTLWLNGLLGDETRTTVVMLVGMMVIPYLVRRVRERRKAAAPRGP